MHGYQLNKNAKKLYSFEDNCVYHIEITDQFTKVIVTNKHNSLSDTEKICNV